ncbi:hypothetical protein Efla_003572 [Eimeria flavescens]
MSRSFHRLISNAHLANEGVLHQKLSKAATQTLHAKNPILDTKDAPQTALHQPEFEEAAARCCGLELALERHAVFLQQRFFTMVGCCDLELALERHAVFLQQRFFTMVGLLSVERKRELEDVYDQYSSVDELPEGSSPLSRSARRADAAVARRRMLEDAVGRGYSAMKAK